MTREEWLLKFVDEARPIFKERAGLEIPPVRVSIGFTSKGVRGKVIGECWYPDAISDGVATIFIDPKLDVDRIPDVLTHELIHACDVRGHGKDFRAAMRALGLAGKPTATVAGDGWHAWACPIIEKIGEMPHGPLTLGSAEATSKKQKTRMIKCECEMCGFVFRTASKWLDQPLRCPSDGCAGSIKVG